MSARPTCPVETADGCERERELLGLLERAESLIKRDRSSSTRTVRTRLLADIELARSRGRTSSWRDQLERNPIDDAGGGR